MMISHLNITIKCYIISGIGIDFELRNASVDTRVVVYVPIEFELSLLTLIPVKDKNID
jgi:hypothetical protein